MLLYAGLAAIFIHFFLRKADDMLFSSYIFLSFLIIKNSMSKFLNPKNLIFIFFHLKIPKKIITLIKSSTAPNVFTSFTG